MVLSFVGSKTVHVFTTSGKFNITSPISNVEILKEQNGGGNGMKNGGGISGGGVLYLLTPVNPSPGEYTITVGAGGQDLHPNHLLFSILPRREWYSTHILVSLYVYPSGGRWW